MTYDHELLLIAVEEGENEAGDPIQVPVKRPVLCGIESITRSEHYQAAQHGLKPEIVFVINRHEYHGEQEAEFEGKKHRVLRTYMPSKGKGLEDFEALELVCGGVQVGG